MLLYDVELSEKMSAIPAYVDVHNINIYLTMAE